MENLNLQYWNARVYHLPRKSNILKTKKWRMYRNWIIKRDGCCKMCGSKGDLTVHHIKPREEKGSEVEENLLTLCNKCHDVAELEALTKEQIVDFYVKEEAVKVKEVTPTLDWHKWVYGGYRRPV